MKFYSFQEIEAHGSCRKFAEQVLGIKVSADGRCQAVWRGGSNPNSVALTDKEWYDHSQKIGGGLLKLCQITKFSSATDTTLQQAQEFLGEWLRLTPKNATRRIDPEETRYGRLVKDGYKEDAKYYYRDLNGNTVHITVKMVHPQKPKEFLQRTPRWWGLGDTTPILYNLSEWADSPWVVIVEGEKDVETLRQWRIPATTNAGGSKKWRTEYNEMFRGKSVIICRDNDDSGKLHAFTVLKNIARSAKEIKMLCLSALPKGDVTDWRDKEGGTLDGFMQAASKAQVIPPDKAENAEHEIALAEAKEANKKPFANSHFVDESIDGSPKKRTEKPRKVMDIVNDCHIRFLGFPRKIGDSRLFDHDRATRKIVHINCKADLFAWVSTKSCQNIWWKNDMAGAVSKDEFYAALVQNAARYENTSNVPDWPMRPDVYYTCGEMPAPDPDHRYFNRLVDFFNPSDHTSLLLIRAFLAAPIFYRYAVQRPCWVIDSVDGASVGKSTLAEIAAFLYDSEPMMTTLRELNYEYDRLIKRLISSTGRGKRVLIVDNVTGDFRSPSFAQLVTSWNISGNPPYGRGEETRPNNLTYCITSNSASLDNDISSRSFIICLKRPANSENWKRDVIRYIRANRHSIFADITDILDTHTPFQRQPISRFPEFETQILQPMCGTAGDYDAVCKAVLEARSETNLDEDNARQIEDEIINQLSTAGIDPKDRRLFIRTEVISHWLGNIQGYFKPTIQDLRNYAKMGHIKQIDKQVVRFPTTRDKERLRRRGVMWTGEEAGDTDKMPVQIVGFKSGKTPTVIDTIYP